MNLNLNINLNNQSLSNQNLSNQSLSDQNLSNQSLSDQSLSNQSLSNPNIKKLNNSMPQIVIPKQITSKYIPADEHIFGHMINITINKKYNIIISKYASYFSLKSNIKKKYSIENGVYKFGNLLLNDSYNSKSLKTIGLANNCNLEIMQVLKGGNDNNNDNESYLFWYIYYLLLIIFIIFVISGFIPVVANSIFTIFENTLMSILDYFTGSTSNGTFVGICKLVIKSILWILKTFSTLFYVWVLTAYMIFPWLYQKASKYCESAITAKNIGWWAMFIYGLFYSYINLFDFLINICQTIVSDLPTIFNGFLSPPLQLYKEAWDEIKFTPFYIIPLVFNWHYIIEMVITLLYTSSSYLIQLDCKKSIKNISDLFQKLVILIDQSTGKSPQSSQISPDHSETKTPETKTQLAHIDTKIKINDQIDISLMDREMMAPLLDIIKDYKMYPLIKLLCRGFTDIYHESIGENKDENTDFPIGSFDRWTSYVASSIFCQLIEGLTDVKNNLNSIGNENVIINMIKSGNISGIATSIYVIVMIIYTFFFDSFSGVNYG